VYNAKVPSTESHYADFVNDKEYPGLSLMETSKWHCLRQEGNVTVCATSHVGQNEEVPSCVTWVHSDFYLTMLVQVNEPHALWSVLLNS